MAKKILAIFLAILLANNFVGTAFIYADEIDDKKAEKMEIEKQMQIVGKRQAEARRRAERASEDFNAVVKKLNNLQKRAGELKSEKGRLEASVAKNEKKLSSQKQELDKWRQIYSKRLRDIYINGNINYLDVLLGAKDFGDFIERMYLLNKIANRDMEMVQQISGTVKDIAERTKKQERELAEIKNTQEKINQDQVYMKEQKSKRKKLLESAENEKLKEDTEFNKLLELSERIGQMLKEMEKVNPQRFEDKADNFIWPCCGVITSYAGWRFHPILKTKKYHSGMDIGVDYYTPVKAANRGTVTYAGWMNGYGNVVMIDHGEGLVTLYAHNSSIKCNEGDFVHQGDIIALSGATGWATGPHLHFEVRLHGEIVDPLNYISEKDNIY